MAHAGTVIRQTGAPTNGTFTLRYRSLDRDANSAETTCQPSALSLFYKLPALTGLLLLCASALSAQGQSRDFGVDVSHYQGSSGISPSAWNQMFVEGRRFTFIKATEGLTGPDDAAMTNNVARATAEGLLVGVYHYAHPGNRPTPSGAVQEANHLLAYAGGAIAPGRLPPALDLEGNAANLTASALTDWVIAFCDEIIAQRGPAATPIIYCSQYFANSKLDSRLANCNLWLTDPGSSADPATDDPPGSTYPKPTGVFNNWCFWQYSVSGSVGGISPIDMDVCHNEFKPLLSFVIRPFLQLAFTSTDVLSLNWPSTPVPVAVQSKTDLDAGNWATLTNTPLFTNGTYQVQLPMKPGQHFYRLTLSP